MAIKGFRCLRDVCIEFDPNLTVVVGENDAGKSSLIDCIRVVTQAQPVETSDFSSGTTEMCLALTTDDFEYRRSYRLVDDRPDDGACCAVPTRDFLGRTKSWLTSLGADLEQESDAIKAVARTFGIPTRSNSVLNNLVAKILATIKDLEGDPEPVIAGAQVPPFSSVQLDGTHFEDVSAFFKETYLKQFQGNLWYQKIDDARTIDDVIRESVDSFAERVGAELDESGIKEKIRLFLPTLTDIKIVPDYSLRDLNFSAHVKLLEEAGEIDLIKKGDGTKRRITMALLEHKMDTSRADSDDSTLYLLDEPDTHLHVRAQLELLDTLLRFSELGHQIIVATHSPFLINAVGPQNIRMLCPSIDSCTTVKAIRLRSDGTDQALRAMGIENVYLYFARKLVLVEGETEDRFLHSFFLTRFGREPGASLVKIMVAGGIQNVYGFCRAISELHESKQVYVLHDNEMSDDLSDLVSQLSVPCANRYVVGNKEFEDAFASDVLYHAWADYLGLQGKSVPPGWTIDSIDECKQRCQDEGRKFSSELRKISAGSGKKMSKPIFGHALGCYVDDDALPVPLVQLIRDLRSA